MTRMKIWQWAAIGWLAMGALGTAPVLRAGEGELQISTAAVRRAVIATIETQLAAFRAHDPVKAYTMAGTTLKQVIPQERFTEVVQQKYPEIWANASASYGVVQDNGVRALLTVRVVAASGASASYDYVLFLEPGGWRIGGVLRHEAKAEGAT